MEGGATGAAGAAGESETPTRVRLTVSGLGAPARRRLRQPAVMTCPAAAPARAAPKGAKRKASGPTPEPRTAARLRHCDRRQPPRTTLPIIESTARPSPAGRRQPHSALPVAAAAQARNPRRCGDIEPGAPRGAAMHTHIGMPDTTRSKSVLNMPRERAHPGAWQR